MKRYEIFVTGKEGIFDPAGKTSKNALCNLGYKGVEEVRIGKLIELDVADEVSEKEIQDMCEKLLTNPVIEDYEIKSL